MTEVREPSRWHGTLGRIVQGNGLVVVLAVALSFVVGGVLIAATDADVQQALGYFFARPSDTFVAVWEAVSGAYAALFRGSIYNYDAPDVRAGIRPLLNTLAFATPLIAAGLGVAVAFRVGMFNIGGRGQMLMAASAAGWVGFSFSLPPVIHTVVAVFAGVIAGALWAGIAGVLKARTGAHEVIVTIMLNYIAYHLVSFMLQTPGLLQAPGNNPISPPVKPSAAFPLFLQSVFGEGYGLQFGFVLVIIATVIVWWLLNRSSTGFRFRAVGENPFAARAAGIDVRRVYISAMLIAGALVGLAGVNEVLKSSTRGFTAGVDSGIGFDAITVALLGQSTPWGTFAAGLLFGALKAGSFTMRAAEQITIEIVVVVQSLIVLFIAAPPLVRTIFGLPTPDRQRARQARARKRDLRRATERTGDHAAGSETQGGAR